MGKGASVSERLISNGWLEEDSSTRRLAKPQANGANRIRLNEADFRGEQDFLEAMHIIQGNNFEMRAKHLIEHFRKQMRAKNSSKLVTILSISLIYLIFNSNAPLLSAEGQELGQQIKSLPDLTSSTSDEPIVAVAGQDAFISCVAKNLQNYTIIWRFSNDAHAPGLLLAPAEPAASNQDGASLEGVQLGAIISAGRQRVIGDERFSVIQSHDTWLLKISQVKLSDTGTYICHTNSRPKVRALRILSVIPSGAASNETQGPAQDSSAGKEPRQHFDDIDFNFVDCCKAEYVLPRCQRLCSFKQLASKYQAINIVHECYSVLPSITRCMVAGRNNTDCCARRHIPERCNPICGHLGDTSAMSVQDQSYCADYSATIMSCVADGFSSLPGQPELVIVEAISSTTLKVSWQKISDLVELKKIDGFIINLTKLSSFEDSIGQVEANSNSNSKLTSAPSSTTYPKVSSSFSTSTSTSGDSPPSNSQQAPATLLARTPLTNLTIVDVMNNSSLAAMTKLLSASSGTISLKLNKFQSEYSIENLKPYTVYQIQMFSYNSIGKSQLTDPIRALTLAPDSELSSAGQSSSGGSSSSSSSSGGQSSSLQTGDAYVEPNLPDTRKCCLDRGVTLKRCLDTLCDPVEADKATIADLMICAPWSNVTFSCLASQQNHTNCCKARGVSPFCLQICSGEIKRVDYRHFRCLTHMSTYTNCILESHDVLPSAPQNFTVGPITHTWAVLNWRPPKKYARSLQGYRIFWRKVEPMASASNNNSAINSSSSSQGQPNSDDDFYYSSAEAATNPYLLDALLPSQVYEAFVVAVNKFGQSQSSVRFIFQTLADPERVSKLLTADTKQMQAGADSPLAYNETSCCASGGVSANCLQLCSYNLKVQDVSTLISATCNSQMPIILRCLAGSRNSVPCCRNRQVSDNCLNVCAGLTEQSPLVVATRCASDFGKIIKCLDDGSKQIPGAPIDLHISDIKADRVLIRWLAAKEDSQRLDIEYHIRYQQLQQPGPGDQQQAGNGSSDLSSLIAVVPLHPLEHNLIVTTNKTEALIDKLKPNSRYSIYVTAENSFGISLPSLVLIVQTPTSDDQVTDNSDYKRRATLGAPHSLEVLRTDTESIVLKWIAPLFMSSDAQIKYRVFYKLFAQAAQLKPANESSVAMAEQTAKEATATATATLDSAGAQVQQLHNNWTVIETSETSVLLKNLQYSSQYVITVQAYSKQMLGHMSEILLASTTKPIPPTLNHPLVIGQPIEGNNITIMCVALGQPTPQISMFINGLLVQKRVQPYVIYHLVNLVREHLTITCFASNGHGKDYASVQSRTELSVRFPAKCRAKSREVLVNQQSTGRISCEVSGNPQPTVVWTFTSNQQQQPTGSSQVVNPNERITTLLVSQFENPFTWIHTLTIKNVSKNDSGLYSCRARNSLAEAIDSTQLTMLNSENQQTAANTSGGTGASTTTGEPESMAGASNQLLNNLKQLDSQNSDLLECCKQQNVTSKCLNVCASDGLDVESAFRIPECQQHLDKLMFCAADGSDHRNCCRTKQVPASCLRWCSGAKLSIPAFCFLSSAIDINQCFQEGRSLLPGPPRNIRVLLATQSEHNGEEQPIFSSSSWQLGPHLTDRPTGGESSSNSNNSSVISSMVMTMGESNHNQAANDQAGSGDKSSATSQEQQMEQALMIEWDAPIKNAQLVQYYRIFWRPFGSRELSRLVTNSTWIKLTNLSSNKIYEFVVKAANQHGSSIYSDPITIKPSEIIAQAQANSLGSAGLIWFMPTSQSYSGYLAGRILISICFATMFMFSSLVLVIFLEKRGYLSRFGSSKSNSSRISFANPAYLKDDSSSDNNHNVNLNWEQNGHSLDILSLPPQQAHNVNDRN